MFNYARVGEECGRYEEKNIRFVDRNVTIDVFRDDQDALKGL